MFVQSLLAGLIASVFTLGSTLLFAVGVLKYTNAQNAKKRSSVVELADVDQPIPYKFPSDTD